MVCLRHVAVVVLFAVFAACQAQIDAPVPSAAGQRQGALDESGQPPLPGVIAVIATLRAENGDERAIAAATDQVLLQLPPGAWRLLRRYEVVPAVALTVQPVALAALRQMAVVDEIGPDRVLRSDASAADIIGATQAHASLGLTGAGVRIAVVDSGVAADHPDLKGKVVAEHCFAQSGCPGGKTTGSSAKDANGHGTHVSSLLVGAGKVAPQGIAPGAQLVVVRTMGQDGTGATSDVLAGLDWIAKNAKGLKISVLNLSLGSDQTWAGACDQADPATAKAVTLLRANGVAVFAAAGNGGIVGGLATPACLTGVTSVGATYTANFGKQSFGGLCSDKKSGVGTVACFSNRSKDLDLLAPGAYLLGAGLAGGTATMAGPSQACPVAAGAAALLLGCNPKLTPDSVQAALQKSGKPVADAKSGAIVPLVQVVAAAVWACP